MPLMEEKWNFNYGERSIYCEEIADKVNIFDRKISFRRKEEYCTEKNPARRKKYETRLK